MADLNYTHAMTGRGVGAGLPLMPGSELYNVDPMIRYPLVLSTGVTRETGQYTRAIYLRDPHQPITGEISPYVNNHKAGGTFLRSQYFTIKRGEAVQVRSRRQTSVGIFKSDQSVEGKTYADPSKFARPRIDGYTDGTAPISVSAFQALTKEQQAAYKPTYSGDVDSNDPIVTGGHDFSVEMEKALTGGSSRVEYVSTDIEGYYGGHGVKFDGFMQVSTGGFPVTRFFNARDQKASVVLPTNGSDVSRIVTPLSTADVSLANVDAYKDSAIVIEPGPTVGVSHTDLEQTLNLRYYNFRTGMEPRGYIAKGRLSLPFVDIEKLHTILAAKMVGSDYSNLAFTDQTENRSGLKVGVDVARDFDVINKYSLLTANDNGYAHLVNNFWAPFATFSSAPMVGDALVPDLFGKYVKAGSGALEVGAPDTTNAFALAGADKTANVDGAMTVSDAHKMGYIEEIRTIERPDIIDQVVNPMWQTRMSDGIVRQINHGYNRVTGADTAGIAPMLTDFAYMLLGGSNMAWASAFMPTFNGVRQDLAFIIEDLVYEGALGVIDVILDTSIAR